MYFVRDYIKIKKELEKLNVKGLDLKIKQHSLLSGAFLYLSILYSLAPLMDLLENFSIFLILLNLVSVLYVTLLYNKNEGSNDFFYSGQFFLFPFSLAFLFFNDYFIFTFLFAFLSIIFFFQTNKMKKIKMKNKNINNLKNDFEQIYLNILNNESACLDLLLIKKNLSKDEKELISRIKKDKIGDLSEQQILKELLEKANHSFNELEISNQ